MKTTEQYKQDLKNKNIQIECLEEYKGNKSKILHRCLKHNIEWMIRPNNVLNGQGCKLCGSEKIHDKLVKSQSVYIKDLHDMHPEIEFIGDYITTDTPALHRCKICNYSWKVRPSTLLRKDIISGCPNCSATLMERSIQYFLQEHNIDYVFQKSFADCKYKKQLSFDFYLPTYHMCIEADGEQHYMPICFNGISKKQANKKLIEQNKKDNIKNEYCRDNKIKLLRIPYWDFDNIENILKNELLGGDEYVGECHS